MLDRDWKSEALFEFLDQFHEDAASSVVRPLADYLGRFPGLEEEIAREYADLVAADEEASSTPEAGRDDHVVGPYRIVRTIARGGQGTVHLAQDTRIDRRVALKVFDSPFGGLSHDRLRRFRTEAQVVSKLQHPGICPIYDADVVDGAPYIAMHYLEGATLSDLLRQARQGEPNETLPLAPRDRSGMNALLQAFERLARALHAAHSAGIIHRDVKPGNVMITPDGDPVLLDFGLARDERAELTTRTMTGEIIGTPAYMSPEQVAEENVTLDRRTDVYSLGVAMYECLTLRQPFEGANYQALARAIRSDAVPDPRIANPTIDADVRTVLDTALDKDRSRRYATSLDVAEELRRVREGRPILARPAGPGLRVRRWARRNPLVALASGGTLAALAIALVTALTFLERLSTEVDAKERALGAYRGAYFRELAADVLPTRVPDAVRYAVEAARCAPGHKSGTVLLAALDQLHERKILPRQEGRIWTLDPGPDGTRLLTTCWGGTATVWDVESGAPLTRLVGHAENVSAARFDVSGRRIVSASDDGTARIWDAETGAELMRLEGHTDVVQSAEFDRSDTRIVTASWDGTARIWDAQTGEQQLTLSGHKGILLGACFSDDGRRVATFSGLPMGRVDPETEAPIQFDAMRADRTARVWDAQSGAELFRLVGHDDSLDGLVISPDGNRVATLSRDGTARIWNLSEVGEGERSATHVLRLDGASQAMTRSSDGGRIAIVHTQGGMVLDFESAEVLFDVPSHSGRTVVNVAFDPTGARLATAGLDGTIIIRSAIDGEVQASFQKDEKFATALVWASDGSWLASAYASGRCSLWHGQRPFLTDLIGHVGPVRSASFDHAGERVLTAGDDGSARIWSAHDGSLQLVMEGFPGDLNGAGDGKVSGLTHALFSPDGASILTSDKAGILRLWDAYDGSLQNEFVGHQRFLSELAFLPDGARAMSASWDGTARIWDLHSGESVVYRHGKVIGCAAVNPTSTLLATGGDGDFMVWELPLVGEAAWGQVVQHPRSTHPHGRGGFTSAVYDVAFSPDGGQLVATCQQGGVALLDLESGAVDFVQNNHTSPDEIAISLDAQRLAVAYRFGGDIWCWQLPDGRTAPEWNEPDGRFSKVDHIHSNQVTALRSSPAGGLLASGSKDGTAKLWSLATGTVTQTYTGHRGTVCSVEFSPDGSQLVTASEDGRARIWPTDLVETALRYRPDDWRVELPEVVEPDPASR